MDKNKAILSILVGLMAIDGEIDENEIDEINEFLEKSHYDYSQLEIGKANNMLLLKVEELEKNFKDAVDFLKNENVDEKTALFNQTSMIMESDGVYHEKENELMEYMKKEWNL